MRRHGRAYVLGLLSQAERKNSWQLAELAGDASPDGMQRLLNFSPWDEDAARDALARYVVRSMGDPAAVLAVDETGFLKKGRMSAGVARQYTGTAGRVENCQAGVFAAYVTPDGGRALIDRELYLPEKWTGDRARCRGAGIGDGVAFATKPELARRMIGRARDAGVPFSWVAGDEVYGGNPKLRAWLEEQGTGYVMAVACNDVVPMAAGGMRADEAATLVRKDGWQRLSCADGSKGRGSTTGRSSAPRTPGMTCWCAAPCSPGRRASSSWRSSAAGRRARSPCPSSSPWPARAGESRTASARRRARPGSITTRSASTAPGTGTSPCPCSPARSSPSPPAPPAPAPRPPSLLPAETARPPPLKRGPDACGQRFSPPRTYTPPAFVTDENGRDLIPLTAAEARRLFCLSTRVTRPAEFHRQWSSWRRRRQATARKSHYARRLRDHEALL